MKITENQYEAALQEVEQLTEADESPDSEKRISELCDLIEAKQNNAPSRIKK